MVGASTATSPLFQLWNELSLRYQNDTDAKLPEALLRFSLAGLSIGISKFDILFWALSFVGLVFQSIINVLAGLITYELILSQRKTAISYLIGYGMLLPTICYLSIFTLRTIHFHNIAHMLCVSATGPAILTFRCIEAMHGTLPLFAYDFQKKHSQNSRSKFIIYYASSIQLHFDAKGNIQRFTMDEFRRKIRFFFRMFCETTLIFSILTPTNFTPFPSVPRQTLMDYFHWANLANNYCVGYCLSVCLESGVTGMGIIFSALTGYSTLSIHDDPLLLSSSVQEFWGRRWNRMVRTAMYRGVYKPLRNGHVHRYWASIATFCASGMLHEFVLYLFTFRQGNDFSPSYGVQTMFFCYNAMIVIIQYRLQTVKLEIAGFKWTYLSRPVRTVLVLLTVLPITHWFTDEYVRAKFFSDIAIGFPRIFLL